MNKVLVILTILVLLNIPFIYMNSVSSQVNGILSPKNHNFISRISLQNNQYFNNFMHYWQKPFVSASGDTINNFIFDPSDVELKDDAFHDSPMPLAIEWWYFDAMFSDGYSMQLTIHVLNFSVEKLVSTSLNIYQDGILQVDETTLYLSSEFSISTTAPLIQLDGDTVLHGYIHPVTHEWIYDLSLTTGNTNTHLQFVSCTKGWKGSTPAGEWAVILPYATVTGTISISNQDIAVNGTGYHDHNWNASLLTGVNFGWYWGKFNSKSYTFVWSNILTMRFLNQPLLVINEHNGDYFNIEPEQVQFTWGDLRFTNGLLLPYCIMISAHNENISLFVKMDTFELHYQRFIGFVHYWRYHVTCVGSLTIDSKRETINENAIAEFIRFR